MRTLPPPAVNSVPEAQPPPSCMPMPKINEPITTDTLTGETLPSIGWPTSVPLASAGKNNKQALPSIIICARKPALRPSASNTRNAEVKPKTEW